MSEAINLENYNNLIYIFFLIYLFDSLLFLNFCSKKLTKIYYFVGTY